MAQVCLDLHDALGCKWGDNPYLTISQLKAAAQPAAKTGDPFLQGVCVALQAVTGSGDGVLWREIVETAGADDLFQYAAHIEPEEWELAGFAVFAKSEMRRDKPKKPTCRNTPPAAQRTWVGLTPEEIYDCDEANACRSALAYAIEAKLKEKNT
jgi:hypothetical protein